MNLIVREINFSIGISIVSLNMEHYISHCDKAMQQIRWILLEFRTIPNKTVSLSLNKLLV